MCLLAQSVQAATFKTANFVVTAATEDIARRVANCAEYWRRDLAMQWLGEALPNWYRPCPISVQAGQMGAGGQTTFTFENGEVYGWKMQVQGTLERILDSVIPHEVNHTIFASYFRRPLPRWADEGAATLFEHESEQARQMHLLNRVITTSKRIPLNDLLTIREYPRDMQDVLTLYAEGYSLAGFLVGSKGEEGRHIYLRFLQDAESLGWEKAIQKHYGFNSIALLEQQWTNWIVAGSPPLNAGNVAIAQVEQPVNPPVGKLTEPVATPLTDAPPAQLAAVTPDDVVIRSQSPGPEETIPALSTIDRAPAPLPGVPRQLRVSRDASQAARTTAGRVSAAQTAALSADAVGSGDFRPRALRNAMGSNAPMSAATSTLSPTAEGIDINPDSRHYSFPEARR